MIEYRTGNLLDSEAEAFVNSVNCVGVMGRGIALQFKKSFPDNFRAYRAACERGEVQAGRVFVYENAGLTHPRYIINFPTKRHWRDRARMEDVEAGLRALVQTIRELGIRSIAIPPLGSGLGGLPWPEVRRRIEQAMGSLEGVRVIVFTPTGTVPLPSTARRRDVPRMTVGRAALIGLMHRYLQGSLVPFVSLLELHKLLYLLQEAGQPLRLRFTQGPYGPYAENLRHVLHEIEGHYVSGYGSGGDDPRKVLEIVPGALAHAQRFLLEQPETGKRMQRVGELVEGFESPYGLELLSTVHWIVTRQHPTDEDDLVRLFHEWHPRKQRFSRTQILLALNRLIEKRWVSPGTGRPSSSADPAAGPRPREVSADGPKRS